MHNVDCIYPHFFGAKANVDSLSGDNCKQHINVNANLHCSSIYFVIINHLPRS